LRIFLLWKMKTMRYDPKMNRIEYGVYEMGFSSNQL